MKIQFSTKVSLAVFALFHLLGAYPASAQTPIQNEAAEFLSSDGVPRHSFGFSAEIDGNTAAKTPQI
jgi:hypothetical protein